MATRFKHIDQSVGAPTLAPQPAPEKTKARAYSAHMNPDVSGVLSALPKASATGVLSMTPAVGTRGHLRNIPTLDGTSYLPKLSSEPLADPHVSADAPRPIGVDPAQTGSFAKITATQGAVAHRDTSSFGEGAQFHQSQGAYRMAANPRPRAGSLQRRPRVSKVLFVVVAGVAVVVIALAALGLFQALSRPALNPSQVEDAGRVEQTQTDPGQGILYDGYNYTAQLQDNGQWAFVRTATNGSDPLVLFAFEGTPANVVLYNGIFVIPENLNGSWEVVAWMMGDGSIPTKLTGQDGQPLTGEGQVTGVELNGSNLTLTLNDGETQTIDLTV